MKPVRWMANEQMRHMKYSNKSDCFAMAVTFYECEAKRQPWQGSTNLVVAQKVLSGERLTMPTHTHAVVVSLVKKCWRAEPERRPAAQRVATKLRETFLARNDDSNDDDDNDRVDDALYVTPPHPHDIYDDSKANSVNRIDSQHYQSGLEPNTYSTPPHPSSLYDGATSSLMNQIDSEQHYQTPPQQAIAQYSEPPAEKPIVDELYGLAPPSLSKSSSSFMSSSSSSTSSSSSSTCSISLNDNNTPITDQTQYVECEIPLKGYEEAVMTLPDSQSSSK